MGHNHTIFAPTRQTESRSEYDRKMDEALDEPESDRDSENCGNLTLCKMLGNTICCPFVFACMLFKKARESCREKEVERNAPARQSSASLATAPPAMPSIIPPPSRRPSR